MEYIFQILDADYIVPNDTPVIRLFGKTKNGMSICVFYDKYLPYFYVLPEDNRKEDVIDFLKSTFLSDIVNIEEVKKFLPIGYRKDKTMLLKITIKNPARVPIIRDRILNLSSVKEIFEADILFKYRFMADFNICGMKWYRVNGEPVNTNSVNSQLKVKAESFEEVNIDENTNFKYMSVDIEVVPSKEGLPDSKKDPISIISISFSPSFQNKRTLVLTSKKVKKYNDDVISFETEKDMLEKFVKIIEHFDPDIILGYNIDNFDLPYIYDRLKINRISRTIGRCKQKSFMCKKIGSVYRNSIPGRIVADVYTLIRESVGKGLLRLKRYGLGDVSMELLGENKIDISHSEIGKYWNGTSDRMKKLLDYARKDAELTLRLLLEKQMLDKFIAISRVSGILLQDSLHCSESIRIENLLLKEFNKRDFVIPNKPTNKEVNRRNEERKSKGLKGALVLEPKTGLHNQCIVYLDFRSLYPSLYYSYNICPTTLILDNQKEKGLETIDTPFGTKFVSKNVREGIISKIVYDLVETRDKVKKQMKHETNPEKKRILNAKQLALKYVANASYGYIGYIRARFYVLDIANAITSCGRDILGRTKKLVEEKSKYSVIYGDTDSFQIKVNTTDIDEAERIGKELESLINNQFKGVIRVKIECIFKTLLILTKKRYAGWAFERVNGKWEDKILMKGIETVRRDWCNLVSETLYEVLEIILKEQNPWKAVKYVKKVINDLQEGKTPLDKLVIVKGISRPLHSYKGVQPHVELVKKMIKRDPASAPGVGDRIGFVIVKGPQLVSKRAEDPNYIKEHNLKIDSNYYVENQILPPLERVFEAMGITKSELIGVGKQLGLFDVIKAGIKQKTSNLEPTLSKIDGFICSGCDMIYRRVPLRGRCLNCNSEILFYFGDKRSRFFQPILTQCSSFESG